MPAEPPHPGDDLRERELQQLRQRLLAEVATALRAAPDVRAWPPNWRQNGEIEYFYRSSEMLVRDEDVGAVRNVLRELGALPDDARDTGDDPSRSLLHGLSRLPARVRESQHTPNVLADVDSRLGVGAVTPDHAFVITYVAVCPATEPEVVLTPQQAENPVAVRDALWPPPGDPAAGRDVRVSVVDTGLLDGAARWAPWLAGVRPDTEEDVDVPDTLKEDGAGRVVSGYADPYAGHGTFVSGVLRCVAPAADVRVERVLQPSGFAFESSLLTQLDDALAASPDVITMSAGGTTRRNVPPIAFERLYAARLRHLSGVVLVAAAGNDGSCQPFWPAAFPWCVGVGSMSRDGTRRSTFSNYGSWVDVYAPGEEIVNAYARLKYMTAETGEVRDTRAGIVKWSGTSFSTPIVAGLIAGRMSRTGENAAEAAAGLLQAARGQFRPGVGPRLFP